MEENTGRNKESYLVGAGENKRESSWVPECRSLKHQALFNFTEEPLAQDFQKRSDTIAIQRCSVNQMGELETGGRNTDAKVTGQVRGEKVSL